MITWNDGSTTGLTRFEFPKKLDAYEIDIFSFGVYGSMWAVYVNTPKYFPIVRDYFKTQEESYDFVVSVVTLLELKYPNAKCSNFSFLTKE